MITLSQANKLRSLIQALVDAEVAYSWKGGGDPSEIPYIEREKEITERALENALNELTTTRG